MKETFSILLSFLLMAGHISLTVGTHFCGGEVIEKKIILGETQLGCNMQETDASHDNFLKTDASDIAIESASCCENKYQTFQVTDEYIKETSSVSFVVDLMSVWVFKTSDLHLVSRPIYKFYTDYISPPSEKDIQVLYQTFLI